MLDFGRLTAGKEVKLNLKIWPIQGFYKQKLEKTIIYQLLFCHFNKNNVLNWRSKSM